MNANIEVNTNSKEKEWISKYGHWAIAQNKIITKESIVPLTKSPLPNFFITLTCTCCNYSMNIVTDSKYLMDYMNFCPNCGADMRGETNG